MIPQAYYNKGFISWATGKSWPDALAELPWRDNTYRSWKAYPVVIVWEGAGGQF